jgi:hypothetical protein
MFHTSELSSRRYDTRCDVMTGGRQTFNLGSHNFEIVFPPRAAQTVVVGPSRII